MCRVSEGHSMQCLINHLCCGGALCHDKEPLDTERKSSGYHPSLEHQIHHQLRVPAVEVVIVAWHMQEEEPEASHSSWRHLGEHLLVFRLQDSQVEKNWLAQSDGDMASSAAQP